MTNLNALNIVILGGSGAVGGEVISTLLVLPEVVRITVLTRRTLDLPANSRIVQPIVDVFDAAAYANYLNNHNTAICTFGVGEPSKVSREEFTRVDKQAVLDFAKACKAAGVLHFTLLGSTMADAQSKSFYLRSKGELRDAIAALGFERFSVFQPSMILTQHNRYGFSQAALLAVWPLLSPVLQGGWKKYRGIRVEDLGRAMAHNLKREAKGLAVFHWSEITELAAERPLA